MCVCYDRSHSRIEPFPKDLQHAQYAGNVLQNGVAVVGFNRGCKMIFFLTRRDEIKPFTVEGDEKFFEYASFRPFVYSRGGKPAARLSFQCEPKAIKI